MAKTPKDLERKDIWALISYFEEDNYLAQSLHAIRPFVDVILLVDGPYKGYSKHKQSQDKSHAIIKAFTKTYKDRAIHVIHEHKKGIWQDEFTKRQWMIDQVPEGDHIIIYDADEMILGDPYFFRHEVENYDDIVKNIMIVDHMRYASWWLYPRIYHKTVSLEYKFLHHALEIDKKGFHWDKSVNNQRVLKSVAILHMGEFYIPPRKMKDKINYNFHVRYEYEDVEKTRTYLIMQEERLARERVLKMIKEKEKIIGEGNIQCH